MQAGADLEPAQRLFFHEAGADIAQDRHVALGPDDALAPLGRKREILDVMILRKTFATHKGLLGGQMLLAHSARWRRK